jgi:glutaminase
MRRNPKSLIAAILLATSIVANDEHIEFRRPCRLQHNLRNAAPVAPRKEQVQTIINEAYELYKNDTSGKNADYIPFLAQVDSKMFGVSVVSTDNQYVNVGELKYSFSIQSISKVFTLALAMEELGAAAVFEKIGSEPTGRASTLR